MKELEGTGEVLFREVNVGRGKPKKIFRLSQKGKAHLVEFKILESFETVRKSCMENERFEIDNLAFSYAIYGLPKNLNQDEREKAKSILTKIDSALWELDDFRDQVINKEGYAAWASYKKAMAKVRSKIRQCVFSQNMDKKTVVIDTELQKALDSYIPSSVRNKLRMEEKDFALAITRGPSWIDDYSMRPENYLVDLIQAVTNWDDAGINYVVKHLARNENVDAEAIERLKQWNVGEDKITQFNWQKIRDRLDDIPRIQEEMKKEKERFVQSGGFKRVTGRRDETGFSVTKEMLGKKELDELRKELSELGIT